MTEGDVNRLFTDETTCLFCIPYTICYFAVILLFLRVMSPKHR
jgi:hypothetical protein